MAPMTDGTKTIVRKMQRTTIVVKALHLVLNSGDASENVSERLTWPSSTLLVVLSSSLESTYLFLSPESPLFSALPVLSAFIPLPRTPPSSTPGAATFY